MRRALLALAAVSLSACAVDSPTPLDPTPIGETGLTVGTVQTAIGRLMACDFAPSYHYNWALFELARASGPRLDAEVARLGCLAEADSCDAAALCEGIVALDCSDAGRCDGDVAHVCASAFRYSNATHAVDCAADPDGNTQCDPESGCVAPEACEQDGGTCDGAVAVDCYDGVAHRRDCSQIGMGCSDANGWARCVVETPEPCAPCAGDIAQVCDDGVVTSQSDCSAMGLECDPNHTGGNLPCKAPEPECETGENRCDGDVMRLCDGGVWFEFDCGRFGGVCSVDEFGGHVCTRAE